MLVEQQPDPGSDALLCLGAALHEKPRAVQTSPPRSGPQSRRAGGRAPLRAREVRSYESEYVNALWHLDFHHGSLRVLRPDGQWAYPLLLGVLDDRSRLCCHAQWYLAEGAEELCHGLCQAFQKRASAPVAALTDNGSAMIAAETEQGLARLGIVHENTLPYQPLPEWKAGVVLGPDRRPAPAHARRRGRSDAWTNSTKPPWPGSSWNTTARSTPNWARRPWQRYLNDKDVGRPCPASEQLQLAFTAEVAPHPAPQRWHPQPGGLRFEVPSRYGHLPQLQLRYASWDLSHGLSGRSDNRRHPLPALSRWTKTKMPKAGARPEPSGRLPPSRRHRLRAWRRCCRKSSSNTPPPDLPPAYLPKPKSPHTNPS